MTSISLRPREWTLRLDNAPGGALVSEVHPSSNKDGSLFFNFPNEDAPGWSADYLTRPWTTPISASSIAFSFAVTRLSGVPVFVDPDGQWPGHGLPPNVRPVLIHKNGLDRWWPVNDDCDLRDIVGPAVLTAPLVWSRWSNQNGMLGFDDAAPGSFRDTLANPGRLGLTFGAGDDFGHGVRVTGGSARFTLTEAKFA